VLSVSLNEQCVVCAQEQHVHRSVLLRGASLALSPAALSAAPLAWRRSGSACGWRWAVSVLKTRP